VRWNLGIKSDQDSPANLEDSTRFKPSKIGIQPDLNHQTMGASTRCKAPNHGGFNNKKWGSQQVSPTRIGVITINNSYWSYNYYGV
jgi:hypothetical protein